MITRRLIAGLAALGLATSAHAQQALLSAAPKLDCKPQPDCLGIDPTIPPAPALGVRDRGVILDDKNSFESGRLITPRNAQ